MFWVVEGCLILCDIRKNPIGEDQMPQKKMKKVAVKDEFFYYHIGEYFANILYPDNKKITVSIHRLLGLSEAEFADRKKDKKAPIMVTPRMVRDWIMLDGRVGGGGGGSEIRR